MNAGCFDKFLGFSMKKILFSSVFLFALLFSPAAFSASAGENYRFYCSQCHGLTGKGDGINAAKSRPVQPKDHTNKDQMSRLSDEDIINVIRSGGRATSKSARPALWGGYPAAFFRNPDQRRGKGVGHDPSGDTREDAPHNGGYFHACRACRSLLHKTLRRINYAREKKSLYNGMPCHDDVFCGLREFRHLGD